MTGRAYRSGLTGLIWGANMNWCKGIIIKTIVFGAALSGMASGAPPAFSQTLPNYRCAYRSPVDCGIVIAGGVNANFAHARRSEIGRRLCLALATCADDRATSCRELVDPCGPLIQTRIHHHLSPCVDAL